MTAWKPAERGPGVVLAFLLKEQKLQRKNSVCGYVPNLRISSAVDEKGVLAPL